MGKVKKKTPPMLSLHWEQKSDHTPTQKSVQHQSIGLSRIKFSDHE